MNKFTPGPWIAKQRDTRSVVLAAKGRCPLADCPQWSNRDDRPRAAEAFANAKLFAAAPDLLEALERILEQPLTGNPSYNRLIEHWEYERSLGNGYAEDQLFAISAIARARGEA